MSAALVPLGRAAPACQVAVLLASVCLLTSATPLGARCVVLAISVVSRGGAIPVAWVSLPATQKHAWRGEWRRLWRGVTRHWTVIGLVDRGLYAPWLFRRIGQLVWHPFLRINTGGTLRPAGPACFRPRRPFVPQPGTRWQGRGSALARKPRRLDCTLLACWKEGYQDQGLILTDVAPEASARAGMACGPGVSRVSSARNVRTGSGTTPG